jgi:hypothetical protein
MIHDKGWREINAVTPRKLSLADRWHIWFWKLIVKMMRFEMNAGWMTMNPDYLAQQSVAISELEGHILKLEMNLKWGL